MKKLVVCISLCLPTIWGAAFADVTNTSSVPNSGFFMGAGAGYNSAKFDQNIIGSGISTVYTTEGEEVAYGSAGGPADPYANTVSTLAPLLQIGYFSHFANNNLLWGVKFSYQYLNAASTNQNVVIPQYGSFTNSGGSDNFIGHVTIGSTQTTVTHDLSLLPFIGRSFQNGYVYFGAGPSLFRINSDINDGTVLLLLTESLPILPVCLIVFLTQTGCGAVVRK